MHLIIDIGNTNIKYFIFSNKKIESKGHVNNLEDIIDKIDFLANSIKGIIFSDVRGLDKSIFHKKFDCKIIDNLKSNCKFPFIIKYKSINSIGEDRLGLVNSAFINFPKKDVLIIDLGTCITYDLITKNRHYLGGAISPGFNIRYMSLDKYTSKLPLIINDKFPKQIIGDNTENSIISGVCYGIYSEIEGFIKMMSLKYPNLTIILTGGDAKLLPKTIKSTIFANQYFLAEGLNGLLEYNKQ